MVFVSFSMKHLESDLNMDFRQPLQKDGAYLRWSFSYGNMIFKTTGFRDTRISRKFGETHILDFWSKAWPGFLEQH